MEDLIKQLLKEKNLNPKSLAKDKRRLASFLNEKEVVKTSRLLEEYRRLLKSGQIERAPLPALFSDSFWASLFRRGNRDIDPDI